MKYLHSDLGLITAGSVVVVELAGTEANVLLLDDANLARYRRRESYEYFGGLFTASPARIVVPATRRWSVVVDLGGYAGTVNASIHVIAA